MIDPNVVANHYTTNGDLASRILSGIQQMGKSGDTLSIDDLAPVDEFHIGGREATRLFLDQLQIQPEHHVLDIGCGLGGASRFAAHAYGCHVTGIDLTDEYVETGNLIGSWVRMQQRVQLVQGNAIDMNFPDESFDIAFMLHAGMNLADKTQLAGEAWRVLRPGGALGIYDVMRIGPGELAFPVPWASEPGFSSVASPDQYREALTKSGFVVEKEQSRLEDSLEFFDRMNALSKGKEPPAPLGIHLLMGDDGPTKICNMIKNIQRGCVAPVEMIARKPA